MLMDETIQQISHAKIGLNYLVPLFWWKQFYFLNSKIKNHQHYVYPNFELQKYVDSFLQDYSEHIAAELQEKSNYIRLEKIHFSPQILDLVEWKAISPSFWKIINKKYKEKRPIFTFLDESAELKLTNLKQIQVVFCSRSRSDAFVGFMPESILLVSLIRQIGYELGFVEVQRSKLLFLDRNPEISYTFSQLQKYSVGSCPDMLLMAFNLERLNDNEQFLSIGKDNNETFNESNEAVVDMNTMVDLSREHDNANVRVNDRTLSTGAETPFSFNLSDGFDLDKEYRVNQLFGAKEPQEIEEMKQYAKLIVDANDFIPIPQDLQDKFTQDLERMAEELLEQMMKKKNYKEKDPVLNYE